MDGTAGVFVTRSLAIGLPSDGLGTGGLVAVAIAEGLAVGNLAEPANGGCDPIGTATSQNH